jgi:hypothetical protein
VREKNEMKWLYRNRIIIEEKTNKEEKEKKKNIRQLETGVTAALGYPDRKNTVAVVLDAPARLGETPTGVSRRPPI